MFIFNYTSVGIKDTSIHTRTDVDKKYLCNARNRNKKKLDDNCRAGKRKPEIGIFIQRELFAISMKTMINAGA